MLNYSDHIKPTSGFTLVELSIVLVIIGLVAGGILAGRDLVETAKMRAQLTQIEKYNTAVHDFQTKYLVKPGDMALTTASQYGFNTVGCDGTMGNRDGNGILDGYWAGIRILEYREVTLFWQDLSQEGLIDGSYPGGGATYSSGCGIASANWTLTSGATYIGNYIPAAKIGSGNFVYVYDSATNAGGVDDDNWFGIGAITSVHTDGSMYSNATITPLSAFRIDQKVDDGVPTTGNVRALYINSYWINQPNAQASDSATSCYNTTTNIYSISYNKGSAQACALSIKFQ